MQGIGDIFTPDRLDTRISGANILIITQAG